LARQHLTKWCKSVSTKGNLNLLYPRLAKRIDTGNDTNTQNVIDDTLLGACGKTPRCREDFSLESI
jgi:hypothetical protein